MTKKELKIATDVIQHAYDMYMYHSQNLNGNNDYANEFYNLYQTQKQFLCELGYDYSGHNKTLRKI